VGVTLRLQEPGPGPAIQGELLTCAYMPDGAFVVSGGWDGYLRLWEANQGNHVAAFRTGDKPVAACAVSNDGKQILSGGLDGLLAFWDALTHVRSLVWLAHTRPISSISYTPDGKSLLTSAWDGTIVYWKSIKDRDGKTLAGHKDIVAGCRVVPDGASLVSWSHDGTVRHWDHERQTLKSEFRGHGDRVLAGDVSPDGRWCASGARNGSLKLWDLQAGKVAATTLLAGELRCVLFLLDGETLIAGDVRGNLSVHTLPNLEKVADLATGAPVQAGDLAPAGAQLTLACSDGRVRIVTIDGLADRPLLVTAHQTTERKKAGLKRLLGGRSRLVYNYRMVCPACRNSFGVPSGETGQEMSCPGCGRRLRIGSVARAGGTV